METTDILSFFLTKMHASCLGHACVPSGTALCVPQTKKNIQLTIVLTYTRKERCTGHSSIHAYTHVFQAGIIQKHACVQADVLSAAILHPSVEV